jgi:hypothetical protein
MARASALAGQTSVKCSPNVSAIAIASQTLTLSAIRIGSLPLGE